MKSEPRCLCRRAPVAPYRLRRPPECQLTLKPTSWNFPTQEFRTRSNLFPPKQQSHKENFSCLFVYFVVKNLSNECCGQGTVSPAEAPSLHETQVIDGTIAGFQQDFPDLGFMLHFKNVHPAGIVDFKDQDSVFKIDRPYLCSESRIKQFTP